MPEIELTYHKMAAKASKHLQFSKLNTSVVKLPIIRILQGKISSSEENISSGWKVNIVSSLAALYVEKTLSSMFLK